MAGGIESLEPDFQVIVKEIIEKMKSKGWQPYVAEGRRTVEEQREKVRRGVSKTMNSYHLSGYAADIVDKRFLWNIPLHHQYWKDQGMIVNELRSKYKGLQWGGDWGKGYQRYKDFIGGKTKYFVDVAHVELRK